MAVSVLLRVPSVVLLAMGQGDTPRYKKTSEAFWHALLFWSLTPKPHNPDAKPDIAQREVAAFDVAPVTC
jgi:hypothetical protein